MTQDVIKLLAAQVEQLEAELVKRHVELAGFTGKGYKASAGCGTMTVFAGGCGYLIEYEYDPGEAPCYDVNSPGVGPGTSANAIIGGVLINGCWIDPAELVSESIIEQWVQAVIDSEQASAEDDRAGYERDRYDDARDFAYSQDERAALEGGAYAAVLGAIK